MSQILTLLLAGYFLSLYFSNAGVEIFMVILSLIGLYQLSQNKWKANLTKEFIVANGALLLVGVIGYIVNPAYATMTDSLLKFRWILMVPLIAIVISENFLKNCKLFLKTTLISLPVLAFICLYQFFLGKDPFRLDTQSINLEAGEFYRAVGMAGSLTTAYLIGMVIVFLTAYLLLKKDLRMKEKIVLIFAVISGLVIEVTTISRGPMLILAVALFLGFLIVRKKTAFMILGVSVVAFFVLIFSSQLFYDKFYNLINLKDVSVIWRYKVWLVNLALFKEHPLLGVGFCNPEFYLKEYYEKFGWTSLHFYKAPGNNYTEFLAGTGLLGFATFFYASFLFLKYAYSTFKTHSDPTIRALAYGLLVAQLYFHLSGLIEGVFFAVQTRDIILLFWTLTLALKHNTPGSRLNL